jgi:hypothetical protein
MGQERWLIAAGFRRRPDVARQEVGRVGLEHEPVGRDSAHHFTQVLPAALVVDPAGDADAKTQFEIGVAFLLTSREAMRHASC